MSSHYRCNYLSVRPADQRWVKQSAVVPDWLKFFQVVETLVSVFPVAPARHRPPAGEDAADARRWKLPRVQVKSPAAPVDLPTLFQPVYNNITHLRTPVRSARRSIILRLRLCLLISAPRPGVYYFFVVDSVCLLLRLLLRPSVYHGQTSHCFFFCFSLESSHF